MNKKTNVPAPVGGSSLLVIFSVLCLTVFSMLVLATVKADERLAEESYDSVTAYYQADCEAERILGNLRAGIVDDGVVQKGDLYAYSCPVSDTQVLRVVVEVTGQEYKVHRWELEETTRWEPEEYMELFDVDDFMEE